MNGIFNPDFIETLSAQVADKVIEKLTAANLHKAEAPASTKYLTRSQAAGLLKCSAVTLNTWTKSGKIKAHRIGGRVLYKESEISEALKPVKTKKHQ